MTKIKVMVVEDSAFMRKILRDIIGQDKNMELIITARDGVDALKKLETIKPDVITLDVNMPRMDGITTLREIKKAYDIPVIMLSSLTAQDSKITIEALAEGAYDFVEKPSGGLSINVEEMKDELLRKIRNTRQICCSPTTSDLKKERIFKATEDGIHPLLNKAWSAIAIGASTGGPKALTEIVTNMPNNINSIPVFIVQHMPKGFTTSFAQRLDSICKLRVKEAADGELIKNGHVYIAPGDFHMTINGKYIALDKRDKHLGVRPAVDHLFKTAADVYKDKLLSIVLTGMGKDGTRGMEYTRDHGGINIAQDMDSSVIFGMPGSAINNKVVDEILSLNEISKQLKILLEG